MLAALALTLLGQLPCGPAGPIFCGGESLAFFEFAPLSGRGMTAACACTTPTGAKGEALTFTRASSATCLKGGTTSGIANGDMVTCSTNQPRVMPGGDGTGGLGLLVEGTAGTNVIIRSQEWDNVAWTPIASGVAVPTVTADQAVAPDGTTTAERVVIPATSGAQYSMMQSNSGMVGGSAHTGLVYIKGNGTTGSTCLALGNVSGGSCLCSYVSSSWTACKCENKTNGASQPLFVGNYSAATLGGCGGVAFGAQDIFVWGADAKLGTYATSYVATTTVAVTRAAEPRPSFATADLGTTTASMALTLVTNYVPTTGVWFSFPTASANPDMLGRFSGGNPSCYTRAPGSTEPTVAGQLVAGVNRLSCDTSKVFRVNAGSTAAAAAVVVATTNDVGLGNTDFGVPVDAVFKRVCFDSLQTRCR